MVVTACNNLFERVMTLDLLPTLRNDAKFTGKIVFIDYGCTKDALRKIANFDVIIKSVNVVHSWSHTYNLRNVPIMEIVEEHTDVTHVLVCDGGDIWFQKPIDDVFQLDGIGHVVEPSFCDNPWFEHILAKLKPEFQRKVRLAVKNKRMQNSGMIVGERRQFLDYMKIWHETMCSAVDGFTPFGLCQVADNYLIATRSEFKFIELPRTYNYMPQSFPYSVVDGKLLDEKGEIVVIGHNAGQRLVPRIVEGVDVNLQNHEKCRQMS